MTMLCAAATERVESPGSLQLDAFGVRGESRMLFVSVGQVAVPFLDLGALRALTNYVKTTF